ncbi:helix-turn-helix transcriptional regulator [Clostridioides difficile]|uniref:helix-turn-helix transcriptional regulator n=1 Tax=Clostridioides difficile TaxID=1496 RepID=UPI001F227572|nr:helix-turn-helix transcriptional regulator [Clostridioides difficile]
MKKTVLDLSKFEPVLEYTNINYKSPISINKIATVAHLQPEYFCRKFKQYMGQTYLEYLNDVRISHIYKDLINTNDTLCSILETHGFTNTKLFYRIFKEKFKCTPKHIRKNLPKI